LHCKEKEKTESAPLSYLHSAPTTASAEKKEGKEKQKVFDHTLQSLGGTGDSTILPLDYFQVTAAVAMPST
jgi:hypothetical protein